jgi:hypothetical protein
MAWGIPGNVGEIYRKQQSDELKDQLLQQEMAARMREADLRQQELSARIAEQRQMEAERAKAAERQTSLDLEKQLSPGAQTPAAAAVLRRYPATAARLSTARLDPAFGTPPIDVLAPNEKQAADATTLKERDAALEQISADPRLKTLVPLLRGGLLTSVPANAILPDEPKPPTKYRVTVKGPHGEPMATLKTEDELGPGVEEYRAPDRPPRTEMTPGQQFQATRQLRNDFVRETKAAMTVQQQLAMMDSSLDAAKKGDLASGSQGVLVTFQKILDPNSVVRESEYARSAAGQSLLSRMEGAATRLISGGAGVPVNELEKFVTLGKQFVQGQADSARETKTQIDAIASEFGIDPKNITRDYGEPPTGGGGGGGQDWLKVPAAQRPVGAKATLPNVGAVTWDGTSWVK